MGCSYIWFYDCKLQKSKNDVYVVILRLINFYVSNSRKYFDSNKIAYSRFTIVSYRSSLRCLMVARQMSL